MIHRHSRSWSGRGELERETASWSLALVDELDLGRYHPLQVTRTELLRRLGRLDEAAAAYETAAALTANAAEREFLDRRRQSLLRRG